MQSQKMPIIYLGHGSPTNSIEDNNWTSEWRRLGEYLPKPKSILCLSAHFATRGSIVVDVEEPETIHDFYGFPEEMYLIKYPAPGSPALANRVLDLIKDASTTSKWGLDHGAWSLLVHLYPEADIPVVQLSLDLSISANEQMNIGKRLRPLREEGVLILGSGNVVHNLRRMNPGMSEPYSWALEFDKSVANLIKSSDYESLQYYMSLPGATESVPTNEHFVPLLYVLGAVDTTDKLSIICQDYPFASLSMTGFIFQ